MSTKETKVNGTNQGIPRRGLLKANDRGRVIFIIPPSGSLAGCTDLITSKSLAKESIYKCISKSFLPIRYILPQHNGFSIEPNTPVSFLLRTWTCTWDADKTSLFPHASREIARTHEVTASGHTWKQRAGNVFYNTYKNIYTIPLLILKWDLFDDLN